ncbi:MAG: tyrosine-protein phosphatase [Myxococcales bacterium]|nr:tyrosine-protein phosphatase [Myxococcales bacterium]
MFERVANFRDIGGLQAEDGLRVRRGVTYRSAALDWMTRADAVRARDELGLKTVIDLRATHEVQPLDRHPLVTLGIAHEHAPLSNPTVEEGWKRVPPYGVESYILPLRHAQPAIRTAFERLAMPNALPAVFHCAAGKDRTGLFAALLLDLLGVSEDDIVADYCASQPHLQRVASLAGRDPARKDPSHYEVQPESLRGTLRWLREHHGSTASYLRSVGVPTEAVVRLSAQLTVSQRAGTRPR